MTNNPLEPRLRELVWRRKLTASEETELKRWLAAHPQAQTDCDAELILTEALDRLPDAPVPTNFTSQVLAAIKRDDIGRAEAGELRGGRWWLRWLPRTAAAAVILTTVLLSYHGYENHRRAQFVRTLTVVSGAPLYDPEVLTNFDVIRAMSPAPAPDSELLTLLQ
ncbi:MAG TPA: hypothetical protein VG146_21680 [Verrucomicrobiae bacterium]|nr:hypothetical protein [Verrucomicrobiae bacterium]